MAKLVWQVKLIAELRPGVTTETEVACIERDEQAGLAELGLRLAETKQLTAALQAQIVPTQVVVVGGRRCSCVACGRMLASKGHYGARFRSLFGDVPVRVRRMLICPCQDVIEGGTKSFAVLDLGKDGVAPELAYVTARYAALLPFGKVATLLSELLPIGGAQNTGTVRNRTLRVGQDARRQRGEPISTAFVESAVNETIAKRMNKKQQMRWSRATVQPFRDVRTAVLNDTLRNAFRSRHPSFRPANDEQKATAAVA